MTVPCEIEIEGNALDSNTTVGVNCRPKAMPRAYLASFFYCVLIFDIYVVMIQTSDYYLSRFWSPDFGASKLKGLDDDGGNTVLQETNTILFCEMCGK
jgi:hypothetical protein